MRVRETGGSGTVAEGGVERAEGGVRPPVPLDEPRLVVEELPCLVEEAPVKAEEEEELEATGEGDGLPRSGGKL